MRPDEDSSDKSLRVVVDGPEESGERVLERVERTGDSVEDDGVVRDLLVAFVVGGGVMMHDKAGV